LLLQADYFLDLPALCEPRKKNHATGNRKPQSVKMALAGQAKAALSGTAIGTGLRDAVDPVLSVRDSADQATATVDQKDLVPMGVDQAERPAPVVKVGKKVRDRKAEGPMGATADQMRAERMTNEVIAAKHVAVATAEIAVIEPNVEIVRVARGKAGPATVVAAARLIIRASVAGAQGCEDQECGQACTAQVGWEWVDLADETAKDLAVATTVADLVDHQCSPCGLLPNCVV